MKLFNSSETMLAYVAELNMRRIGMVLGKRQKRLGGMELLTQEQRRWLLDSRKLHHRYTEGRYQHTDLEMRSVKNLMGWLVQEHKANEGFSEEGKFEFNDAATTVKKPVKEGAYAFFCQKVHE